MRWATHPAAAPGSPPVPRLVGAALVALALCAVTGGCESPFEGPPQRPRDSASGLQLDQSKTDIPTQQELDEPDEGLDAGPPQN